MFKFAAVLLLLSWPANAEDRLYYTFSEWARLQDDDRVAYISGLLDTFAMAATEPTQRPAQHYRQCITRSRLTSKQLANYLREYGRARPEMQANSVQDAITLMRYADSLPVNHAARPSILRCFYADRLPFVLVGF
jgi:hypothetical protein